MAQFTQNPLLLLLDPCACYAVYDTVFEYTRSTGEKFNCETTDKVWNDMMLLIMALIMGVILFAVRPVAVTAALLKVVLLGVAAAAGFTVYVAGPHPLFIGLALVSGVSWLLLVAPRPRRARAFA